MQSHFDVAVIGNGMIGSAGSRYLSAAGLRVAAIGPGEPEQWQTHRGVFASHYDQGRITRITDPDRVWGVLAKRSIEAYSAIESKSGVHFHHRAGQLRISPDTTAPGDTLNQCEQIGRELGAIFDRMDRSQLVATFPYLHFPAKAEGLWERGDAGFVNPRALVQAQLTIAAQQGATVIRQEATAIDRRDGQFEVALKNGERIRAQKILVATGGFTNQLLDARFGGRTLDLRPRASTVVLAELGADELRRVHGLPTLIWRLEGQPVLESIYSAAPTRYPDGRTYFKMGGTLHQKRVMTSPDALRAHFQSSGFEAEIQALKEVTLTLLPGLKVESWQSKPCVTTYTANGYPYVDQLEDGFFLAAGGCGSAAKSSNELGHIAALLVEHGIWEYDVEAKVFEAHWL